MADELRYIVKFDADDASYKAVKDKLDGLTTPKPSTDSPFAPLVRDAEAYGEVANKTLKRLVELNDQITNNRSQIKSLTEASKENTAEGLASAEQLALLKAENKDLTAEYRTQEAVLNANKVAVDGGTMSYAQMSARMRELKDEMRQIVPNTASNVKALDAMKAEYGTLNTKLKEFDASVGNHQRNVGNYENSLRSAANALAVFQGPLGPIAGRINAFATVLSRLNKTQDEGTTATKTLTGAGKVYNALMVSTIPLIKTTEGATKAQATATLFANGAIKLLNGSLKVFRLALAATGIGALVLAISGLVAFFKAGEEGSMALARRMAPLKAIVLVLRDAFASVGKVILDAFDNPKQAVVDLWEAIKTNIVNRIKGVADTFVGLGKVISASLRLDWDGVKAGMKDVTDGIIAVAIGVANATDKMGEFGDKISYTAGQAKLLETQMQNVVLAERELNVLRSKQNRDLREAMSIARDETKTFQERLSAMKVVMDAENEMLQAEMALERERLRIMEAQASLAKNSKEENEALMAQEMKLNELEEKHFQVRLRAQETINMISRKQRELQLNTLREGLAQQQRFSELEIARVEQDMIRKGEIVELAEMRLANFDKRLLDERRARIEAYNQELINKHFSAEEAKRLATIRADQELEAERLALDKEAGDAELARAKAIADATLNINKTQAQLDLDNRITLLDRQGSHAQAHALRLEKIELDRQLRIESLTEDFVSRGIERTQAVELAKQQITLEIDDETAKAQMATDDKVFEHKQKLLSAYSSIVSTAGQAIFNDNKAFAVAGAVMDTYGAINRTFRQYGYPAGIPFAAAQALVGFANVKKILATKKGTTGGSASTGSTPSIGTSFGLVETGTNQDAANFIASQQSAPSQEVNVYLQGEFDPEYLSLKVAQGNNSLAQRTVRVGA